jgi:hypothetical protein
MDADNTFKCTVCKKTFERQELLDRHKKTISHLGKEGKLKIEATLSEIAPPTTSAPPLGASSVSSVSSSAIIPPSALPQPAKEPVLLVPPKPHPIEPPQQQVVTKYKDKYIPLYYDDQMSDDLQRVNSRLDLLQKSIIDFTEAQRMQRSTIQTQPQAQPQSQQPRTVEPSQIVEVPNRREPDIYKQKYKKMKRQMFALAQSQQAQQQKQQELSPRPAEQAPQQIKKKSKGFMDYFDEYGKPVIAVLAGLATLALPMFRIVSGSGQKDAEPMSSARKIVIR